MQLRELSWIFVSYLHSDQYLELGPLIHTAWTAGLKIPVNIYGPENLETYWTNFLISMQADIDLRMTDGGCPNLRDLTTFHVVKQGIVMKKDGISVKALRTKHPPLIDCFAYSFQSAGNHVVFPGDKAPIKAIEDFARGAYLFVQEAMLKFALSALME